jgi:hypothetical protein
MIVKSTAPNLQQYSTARKREAAKVAWRRLLHSNGVATSGRYRLDVRRYLNLTLIGDRYSGARRELLVEHRDATPVRVEQAMRYGWLVVAVGLAVTAHASDAQAKLDLYVDKSNQRITVVRDGYVRYVWPVSTGGDNYAPPNGVYTPAQLERSSSPMPYTISFHDGYAMQGSYDLTNLSGPASHGSIRLYPQHVATLFAMVEQEGPENTTITIGGDAQPTPPARQSRSMGGEVVRSASLGDGGFGKDAYPPLPRPAPDRAMNQSRPGAAASQGAAYRMPEPRSKPRGDVGRNADAPGRQIDAADQHVAQDVHRTQGQWTPGFGYQVLPRSYWTGGSWRWRWNAGQEPR